MGSTLDTHVHPSLPGFRAAFPRPTPSTRTAFNLQIITQWQEEEGTSTARAPGRPRLERTGSWQIRKGAVCKCTSARAELARLEARPISGVTGWRRGSATPLPRWLAPVAE